MKCHRSQKEKGGGQTAAPSQTKILTLVASYLCESVAEVMIPDTCDSSSSIVRTTTSTWTKLSSPMAWASKVSWAKLPSTSTSDLRSTSISTCLSIFTSTSRSRST